MSTRRRSWSPHRLPVVAAPPVYTQSQQYWYYCQNPAGYYPSVPQCPTQWLQVSPQPAAAGLRGDSRDQAIRRAVARGRVPLLGACATVPAGPSVMVLPGSGKPFEVFQADDDACRQWALRQSGASPNARGEQRRKRSDHRDTARRGAWRGHRRRGWQPGHRRSRRRRERAGPRHGRRGQCGRPAGMSVQRRYDIAYQQCMYAKGNQVPTAGAICAAPDRQLRGPATAPSAAARERPCSSAPPSAAAPAPPPPPPQDRPRHHRPE